MADSVAIDVRGRIVAAGWGGSLGNWDFALARYKPDGSLDRPDPPARGLTLFTRGHV